MPSCLSLPPALQRETQGSAESPPGSRKKVTKRTRPEEFPHGHGHLRVKIMHEFVGCVGAARRPGSHRELFREDFPPESVSPR